MDTKANSREDVGQKVIIRKHDGICVVEPRKLRTKQGNKVVFENLTGDEIQLFFPEVQLFEELSKDRQVIPIPDGKTITLRVKIAAREDKKPDNHYHYAVHCKVFGEFAIANSNPIIIVSW
jgi:hypothetical protein